MSAAVTYILEWIVRSDDYGTFASAEKDGAVLVVARGAEADHLRSWVAVRNGKPQRLTRLFDIRATKERSSA